MGVKSRHSRRGAPLRHTLHVIGTRPSRRVFYFTMTPAPNFAGLRRSPIQQVYQGLRRVQHMTVLSET
ncbi:hypothetical protein APB26_33220 [Pseudomonas aeruginosa]|nr:hypothetical protein APB26_33220 [Pseudomonas aeruginosa]RPV59579.1 hypothetical protein IPC838_21490 [Pseudomonas aeruginosa]